MFRVSMMNANMKPVSIIDVNIFQLNPIIDQVLIHHSSNYVLFNSALAEPKFSSFLLCATQMFHLCGGGVRRKRSTYQNGRFGNADFQFTLTT